MATLFLFIAGIILIILLARYNESNKLFWTLFTCLTIGMAAHVIMSNISTEKKSSNNVPVVQSTQALAVTSSSLTYLLADDLLPTSVKATSNPASQTMITDDYCSTFSNASGMTQGINIKLLPNPPNKVGIVDDS